jgi:hypothetical protein
LVAEALREEGSVMKEKRQAAVASGTWEARAMFAGDLIEKVLLEKSA